MPPSVLYSSDFKALVTGFIAETGVEAIKELSEEVASEMDKLYYAFFRELYDVVSKADSNTPTRFLSNMGGEGTWKPLTQQWSDRKIVAGGSEDFYKGLTAHLGKTRKRMKRRKSRSGKKARSNKPFLKFLNELKGSSKSNTRKLFGDLQIKYAIRSKGRKTPIKIEQKANIIAELGRITSHGPGGKLIPNFQNVSLDAEIEMFPLLKAVSVFSEWYVVDYLSKKQGVDKVQWAKVNSTVGFHGSIRPVRAIITPLISWYATTGLTNIMRKFYT